MSSCRREIRKLGEKKPVVASMGDVAASGGYYMGMACKTIVAEPLTITGSIGVVTGKFNLEDLYSRIGYNKKVLSRGQFAELLSDNRGFTDAEQKLFDASAEHAYRSFRDKAALSRGMAVDAMQEVAQVRGCYHDITRECAEREGGGTSLDGRILLPSTPRAESGPVLPPWSEVSLMLSVASTERLRSPRGWLKFQMRRK